MLLFCNFAEKMRSTLMNKFTRISTNIIASIVFIVAISLSSIASAKEFVVMIDAGHGGKDVGALGLNSHEKDINLSVALLLGNELKSRYKNMKVLYTRSSDIFVTIKGRMDKAKSAHADLFISLHCNSVAYENPRRKTLSGTSVYVLGNNNADDNIDLAMIENSAILLEDDYQTTYKGFDNSPEYYIFTEINQSKMMGKSNAIANAVQQQLVDFAQLKDNKVNETARFWLLLHSTMPAILVEMDFICNPEREKFLKSKKGQDKIAKAIANGIENYCASLGHDIKGTKTTQTDIDESQEEYIDNDNSPITYKIQFLVSDSKLSNKSEKFKGLKDIDFYIDNNSYKYTTGAFKSTEDAEKSLKIVKKTYRDAFIIKTRNGKRIK